MINIRTFHLSTFVYGTPSTQITHSANECSRHYYIS